MLNIIFECIYPVRSLICLTYKDLKCLNYPAYLKKIQVITKHSLKNKIQDVVECVYCVYFIPSLFDSY